MGFGKFGIPGALAGADGKRVAFEGTVIRRRSQQMLEVTVAESVAVLGEAAPDARAVRPLGEVTLRGEIIDTKCFLGVMRPALGKVHRACAIRCVSGGIPPGFRVIDDSGAESILLLAGQPGAELDLDAAVIGLPVEIRGNLEVQGSMAILRPQAITRVQ